MANTATNARVINLDTFSSAIAISNIKLSSIEWVGVTTLGHTATVTLGVGGPSLCEWTYDDSGQPLIKYFPGQMFESIDVAVNAVSSGKLIIVRL